MSNNLDGIKKMNNLNSNKPKKIILNHIYEEPESKKEKQKSNFIIKNKPGIMVDGILPSKQKKLIKKNTINPIFKKQLNAQEIKKLNQEKLIIEKKKEYEEKLKKKYKKEKNIKKKKQIKNFIISLKNKITLKNILKFTVYMILTLIICIIFIYLIFAFILLRTNFKNETIKKISNIIPVPAIISSAGIIDYNEYLKLKNQKTKKQNINLIFEKLIIKKLAKKYKIKFNDEKLFSIKEELRKKIITDQEINKITFLRIDDISKSISSGMDFNEIGEKHGDEFGFVKNSKDYKILKPYIKNLNVDDISKNIFTLDAVYKIKNDNGNFKYIKINNIIFEKYFNNEINNLKLLILIK